MIDNLLSHDDKQKILKLRDNFIISSFCPTFLRSSTAVMHGRRIEAKGGSRNMQESVTLVRVNGDKPLQMIDSMIAGDFGIVREHLSVLFELGLGVPCQKQIAIYVREAKDDKETISALKDIRKMIINFQDVYEDSVNSDYFYSAHHIAASLFLSSFVRRAEYKTTFKTPAGIPVVLVYRLTNPIEGQYTLHDAYDMTLSSPTPFAHIMLRDKINVQKTFTSKGLKKHGSYAYVFGTLTHEMGTELNAFCQDIDIDEGSDLTKEQRKTISELEFIALDIALRSGDNLKSVNSNVTKTQSHLKRMGFATKSETVKHTQKISYDAANRCWGI